MESFMKKFVRHLITVLIIFSFLVSCKPEEVKPDTEIDLSTFEGVIKNGGTFEAFAKSAEVDTVAVDQTEERNGEAWKCTTTRHSIVDGNDEFPLFNPNASVIYPGSLLQGKSLDQATPDVIVVKRAPGTISYDLNNANGAPSFEVTPELTKSGVAEAMNNIISQSPDAFPANFTLSIEQVQSKEEMALSIGVNVETTFTEVEADLSFSKDKEYTRFLVKLNQSYYTMSFDLPTSTDELFAPEVTPADLAKYVGPGNPATYISDVTYGRIFYMLIESTESAIRMESSIRGSFNGLVTKGEGKADASYVENLASIKIKVVAYGGDASGTISLPATIDDISTFIGRLNEANDIRAGLPISYVVRSVLDNQIVNVKLATEYDVKECVPAAPGKFEFLALQSANLSLNPGYKTFIGDANGDGNNDIIMNYLGGGNNQVQVVYGNAAGNFTAGGLQMHPLAIPAVLSWTDYEMQTGDINGDGIVDLIWSNMTRNNDFVITDNVTYVALGNSNGNFDFEHEPLILRNTWSSEYNFYILDINGDNYDDIIWNELNGGMNRLYTALSDSVSSFTKIAGYQDNPGSVSSWSHWRTFIGDVNGDGREDLIWEETGANESVFFGIAKANDPGKFTFNSIYKFGTGAWASYETYIGDVNADSRDDIILVDAHPSRPLNDYNAVHIGLSNGIKIDDRASAINVGPKPYKTNNIDGYKKRLRTVIADINRDGRADILWNDLDGLNNYIYVGLAKVDQSSNNDFSFETAKQTHPDGSVNWDSFEDPILVDVNGDQKPDIIWIRPQQNLGVYVALAY